MKQFFSILFFGFISVCSYAQINIVAQPTVSNITTTGFTVTWTTDSSGTTSLKYGLTPSFELGVLTSASGTTHVVNLIGASASQVYYVQGYSTNGIYTTYSNTEIFITASNSTGIIKCYFTRTVDTTYANPIGNNAVQLPNIVDDTAAAYISRAQSTLDIAMYNLDSSTYAMPIINAINSAYSRGVRIRLICSSGVSNSGLPFLNSSIPVLVSPSGGSYNIMHNKFMIIDANAADANLPVVWTGSTNWTSEQLTNDCNNVIIFQDQSLAIGYTMEFEEMWGGSSATPNLALSLFGPYKTDNTPHEYLIGGKRVESYFSPSDGTTSHIISTVQNSLDNLFFLIYSFTRSDIASAIAALGPSTPVVAGMVNDTGSTGSGAPFRTIQSVIANRVMIYNGTYLLHHKYLIEDVNFPADDPLVETGSHNWSTSAETKNDENIVIVHDQNIANQYFQEFIQRFHDNGGVLQVPENNSVISSIMVFPNPATELVNVQPEMKKESMVQLRLTDVYGRIILAKDFLAKQGANNLSLDISRFSKGIYILKTQAGESSTAVKVVVE